MYRITHWHSEPYHQNQNPAERRYGTIKAWTNTMMNRSGAPANCWLLCLSHVCYLLNHTSCLTLDGHTPLYKLTGITPDISVLLIFHFYQKVYYATYDQSFPSNSEERAAYWVGVGEHVGDAITHKLLDAKTKVIIYRSAVRPVTPQDPNARIDNDFLPNEGERSSESDEPEVFVRSRQDEDGSFSTKPMPEFDPSDLIGRTFLKEPDENGEIQRAIVKDTIIQRIEEADGKRREKINILLNVGRDKVEEIISYNQLLDYIEKDEQDNDLQEQGFFRFRDIIGHQGPLKPSDPGYKGSKWNVQVEWENGEITTQPLNEFAQDDFVTCASYAKKNGLLHLPGWKRFKHIVKHSKTFARAIKQNKLRQVRGAIRYMFGYQIPRNYEEALLLDRANRNSRWYDAVQLELQQIMEYNTFRDHGKAIFDNHKKIVNAPPDYKKIRVHLVFAVKHDGRHKARLVADGHLTPEPVESIYSGVVSLKSLRLVIFLADLNNLTLWAADVGNAYLEAFTREKVYIIAGKEFEELEGHILIVVKALYGLKSSGKMWSERFHDILIDIGFKPSKADPCVWMRPTPDNSCYEYIAVYVDDLCIAARDPEELCKLLKEKFDLKLKGTGPLEYHLGCDYITDPDGTRVAVPRKYVSKIIESYKLMFGTDPPKSYKSPLEKNDHPEIDNSDLLDDVGIKQYMALIGQLQWLITLGRFDILVHVVSMSRFRLAPRTGHLDRLKRIFGYVSKTKHYGIRVRTYPPDYSDLPEQDYSWARSVYGDVTESIPNDIPEPLGKSVVLTAFLDANLLHDLVTGRALTAVLHFINSTPFDWYSKRQATVETATYGSEFVSARIATDQAIDHRQTLRYLGVPINTRTYLFGDNKSVITSSTIPHSTLSKRAIILCYHRVREAVAARIIYFYWVESNDNFSDPLSKHWEAASVMPTLILLLERQGKINIRPVSAITAMKGE